MTTTAARRTPLVLVAGLAARAARHIADALHDPGTVVLHHDLAMLGGAEVRRTVRWGARDAEAGAEQVTTCRLSHGCLSCLLREELLPLLRRWAVAPEVGRVVLHLHPTLEPETVCWALGEVPPNGGPVRDLVDLQAVVTTVDAARWLDDATGNHTLRARGLATGDGDGRAMAQLAVGQVEFADALVVAGTAEDRAHARRLDAVLDRLAPIAPRFRASPWLDAEAVLAAVPAQARRGRVDDVHATLTHGDHPRGTEHGVGTVFFGARRPFHPERLHEALGVLLTGVVRTRGRMWVASRPDEVLALESAGGDLRVARAGPWLAALADWSAVPVQRALTASLRWDDRFEDREQALVVVFHEAEPQALVAAFDAALLTDEELAAGPRQWQRWSAGQYR